MVPTRFSRMWQGFTVCQLKMVSEITKPSYHPVDTEGNRINEVTGDRMPEVMHTEK